MCAHFGTRPYIMARICVAFEPGTGCTEPSCVAYSRKLIFSTTGRNKMSQSYHLKRIYNIPQKVWVFSPLRRQFAEYSLCMTHTGRPPSKQDEMSQFVPLNYVLLRMSERKALGLMLWRYGRSV